MINVVPHLGGSGLWVRCFNTDHVKISNDLVIVSLDDSIFANWSIFISSSGMRHYMLILGSIHCVMVTG